MEVVAGALRRRRGWRRWPSTSATRRRWRSPSASRASGTWPTSSTATPCTVPTCCSAGRRCRERTGEAAWQVELWRLLRERIGQPSPAERLLDACRRLREEPELLDLPPRLSLFGLTRLPASYLDVLDAVGRGPGRPPLPAPSVAGAVGAAGGPRSGRRRASLAAGAGPDGGRAAQPAAAVVGARRPGDATRAGRGGPARRERDRRAPDRGRGRSCGGSKTTSAPTGPRRRREPAATTTAGPLLEADDDSIRVHSCHGRGRQVEVLRDAILHLLEDDPTLEPRDIIVMCPDIENFAPLIQATFGGHDLHGDRQRQTRARSRSAWPTALSARPTR